METKKRLIDADLLEEEVRFSRSDNPHSDPLIARNHSHEHTHFLKLIHAAPTVDALPLRCHIGDPVFVVGTKCLSGLYEEECDTYIHYGKCDDCHLAKEYIVFRRKVDKALFLYLHDLDENHLLKWGKTVFLTRAEAEAALAKNELEEG